MSRRAHRRIVLTTIVPVPIYRSILQSLYYTLALCDLETRNGLEVIYQISDEIAKA